MRKKKDKRPKILRELDQMSDEEIVEANFATVAKPLQSNQKVRDKFYYLFYRRQHGDEEIDKAKLCKCLAQEFSTLSTKRRKYV